MSAAEDATFIWVERRVRFDGAPDGKCWSVREMMSYGSDLDRFVPHLLAMGEGLERAYFTDYDAEPEDDRYSDDHDGFFVIGLRPVGPGDQTTEQRRVEAKEQEERAELARLLEKFPPTPSAPVTDTTKGTQ